MSVKTNIKNAVSENKGLPKLLLRDALPNGKEAEVDYTPQSPSEGVTLTLRAVDIFPKIAGNFRFPCSREDIYQEVEDYVQSLVPNSTPLTRKTKERIASLVNAVADDEAFVEIDGELTKYHSGWLKYLSDGGTIDGCIDE